MNKINQLSIWWDEARSGAVKAFGHIHHELYPLLYQYLLKILKDEDVCQDVLQELFIKMWERRERFGPIGNVRVYFFKAARSMALNYIKNHKSHDPLLDSHQYIDMVFSHEEIMVGIENNNEVNYRLSIALNSLPNRQKEMLFLKYFDDCDYAQIAEVTGIRYQSVVNHVHRAITQLRSELRTDHQIIACRVAV